MNEPTAEAMHALCADCDFEFADTAFRGWHKPHLWRCRKPTCRRTFQLTPQRVKARNIGCPYCRARRLAIVKRSAKRSRAPHRVTLADSPFKA
jgi:ssDNA-binding Zn-finger/Zn-ribbon topoisomerase 1